MLNLAFKATVTGKIIGGNFYLNRLTCVQKSNVFGANIGLDQKPIIQWNNLDQLFAATGQTANRGTVNAINDSTCRRFYLCSVGAVLQRR